MYAGGEQSRFASILNKVAKALWDNPLFSTPPPPPPSPSHPWSRKATGFREGDGEEVSLYRLFEAHTKKRHPRWLFTVHIKYLIVKKKSPKTTRVSCEPPRQRAPGNIFPLISGKCSEQRRLSQKPKLLVYITTL